MQTNKTVHEIRVKKYSVEPQIVDVGTKGSYGNERLQFLFTEKWAGLLVKVSFFPPNIKPVVLLLHDGGLIDIPSEVTRNGGKTQYIVSGHADGRLMKSLVGELNVFNTLNVATTPPNSPTPTEMEQVEQWLLEAIALAQSVRDDADNGVFDGEDGVTPVFSVGQVEKGDEPELTITGTVLNPVLNFTLPKGDKGGTGATGETGATFIPNVSENGIISWNNDRDLPNPQSRDITGPIGPAGVAIGVPPDNDPLKRVWVNPDGEALINEVIDNLIEESTIARDESVEAKGITLEAKDEAIAAKQAAEQSAIDAGVSAGAAHQAEQRVTQMESDIEDNVARVEQGVLDVDEIKNETAEHASSAHESALQALASKLAAALSEGNAEQSKLAAVQALTDLLAMLGTDIATLTDGKLTPSQIPAISINDINEVYSVAELLDLTAERGDVGLIMQYDEETETETVIDSYMLAADDPTVMGNWKKLGVSYVANAGHAVMADNAVNADKINNKRIIGMMQEQYDNAALDDNTYYFVRPDEV
jgi:hypothetical protein